MNTKGHSYDTIHNHMISYTVQRNEIGGSKYQLCTKHLEMKFYNARVPGLQI